MHLVQILLPVRDNDGKAYDKSLFDEVRSDLAAHFGGVTAFTRAPASGLWENKDGQMIRDDVVIFEVMVDRLEREFWRLYRMELQQTFRQETIAVRAQRIDLL
ncbi:MAG TPA: hypothetical protein VF021_06505 [Longimicrobiales bacterium]